MQSGDRSGYKWKVLFTVIFGFFMMLLDVTVINVAFPALSVEFGSSLNQAQWIISVYALAIGISTPLSGFLADRVGPKRVYLGGLALFITGSLFCGLSRSLGMLVAFRIVQGTGTGLVMPLGMALLLQAFPVEEHGRALGYYGLAALFAPALGPLLGGLLVSLNMWRLIFFINPPIGLIGIVLGMRFLRERKSEERLPLDVAGIVAELIGFGALLYATSVAATYGWTAPDVMLWFALGGAGLIAFVLIELYVAKSPLLDLRLFRNRIFLNANLLGYVAVLALFGAEFLLPVYLQSLRGISALETGIILLPMAISSGILVTLSGRIYDRIGPRPLMVIGFSVLAVNTWQLSQLQADTSIGWLLFLLTLRGIALGLVAQTTMVASLSEVKVADFPRGSSLINATRNVVQGIGVAVLATLLASALSPQVQALEDQFNNSVSTSGQAYLVLCDPPSSTQSAVRSPSAQAGPSAPLLKEACQENVVGFERSYRVTFYAALLAVLLGAFLPGWPFNWQGRRVTGEAVAMHS
jgi:DHA2 family multidrug resistance protein